ncbi:DsbA family oxidoreductase [Carnobacterium gallinarum]|uniref:DsbA family oxidoreductase n=1 Tax=Carnobacterium gallinarum TaxID=2749 RepID=UPI0005512EA4|nr:DsbA family protein [Carnobacterium gallinarum]
MQIEFFHDVICSFCFPMSYRMRQLKEEMPEIEIIHRSYALVQEPTDFDTLFGSRENAKKEIMTHWKHANQNDDLHRFNIEGMKQQNFLFPTSMNGLTAVKAAEILKGSEGYWDLFDALQTALFMNNKNIEEIAIIEAEVIKLGFNLEEWRRLFADEKTAEKVQEDIELIKHYGIKGAPSLVINGKYELSGAQPLLAIKQAIQRIKEQDQVTLQPIIEETAGGSCRLEDGNYSCD